MDGRPGLGMRRDAMGIAVAGRAPGCGMHACRERSNGVGMAGPAVRRGGLFRMRILGDTRVTRAAAERRVRARGESVRRDPLAVAPEAFLVVRPHGDGRDGEQAGHDEPAGRPTFDADGRA